MIIFFRCLIDFACQPESGHATDAALVRVTLAEIIGPALYPLDAGDVSEIKAENVPLFEQWGKLYRQFLSASAFSADTRRQRMAAANPAFVLRNSLAQQAIEGLEQGDSPVVPCCPAALKDIDLWPVAFRMYNDT